MKVGKQAYNGTTSVSYVHIYKMNLCVRYSEDSEGKSNAISELQQIVNSSVTLDFIKYLK